MLTRSLVNRQELQTLYSNIAIKWIGLFNGKIVLHVYAFYIETFDLVILLFILCASCTAVAMTASFC